MSSRPLRLAAIATAAGAFSGLFGVGGGTIIVPLLVLWLGSNWPDLLVGLATAVIAIKGGIEILRDARAETKNDKDGTP